MAQTKKFEEEKALIELKDHYNKENHARWMEGLQYQRESEEIAHEHEMERQRIKSAEIRKMQERRKYWEK
jgi:hypothetical protein